MSKRAVIIAISVLSCVIVVATIFLISSFPVSTALAKTIKDETTGNLMPLSEIIGTWVPTDDIIFKYTKYTLESSDSYVNELHLTEAYASNTALLAAGETLNSSVITFCENGTYSLGENKDSKYGSYNLNHDKLSLDNGRKAFVLKDNKLYDKADNVYLEKTELPIEENKPSDKMMSILDEVRSTIAEEKASVSTYRPTYESDYKPKATAIRDSFSNDFGSSSTKCAYSGCTNKIASTGDTMYCTTHSNKCLECGAYIDNDAAYCMSCLTKAANKLKKRRSG